jgi:hypothetical protein
MGGMSNPKKGTSSRRFILNRLAPLGHLLQWRRVQFGTALNCLSHLLWRTWREATDDVPNCQFRHPRSLAISKRNCNLGNRAITADADLRLARYYKISEGTFLGLQSDYELRIERRKLNNKLDFIVPRTA